MRNTAAAVTATILLTVTLANRTQTGAQVIYNSVDLNPSIQTRVDNYMMRHRAGSRAGGGTAAAAIKRIEDVGSNKIRAGNATTKFTSSVEGTKTVVANLNWQGYKEQDSDSQTKLVRRYVELFNALAARNGFKPNDFADGWVFAYALAYAATFNKDLNKADLEKLRADKHKYWLEDTYFQGVEDVNKQYHYEVNAAVVMQAVEFRIKARRAKDDTERRQNEEKARSYAKYLVEAE